MRLAAHRTQPRAGPRSPRDHRLRRLTGAEPGVDGTEAVRPTRGAAVGAEHRGALCIAGLEVVKSIRGRQT